MTDRDSRSRITELVEERIELLRAREARELTREEQSRVELLTTLIQATLSPRSTLDDLVRAVRAAEEDDRATGAPPPMPASFPSTTTLEVGAERARELRLRLEAIALDEQRLELLHEVAQLITIFDGWHSATRAAEEGRYCRPPSSEEKRLVYRRLNAADQRVRALEAEARSR